MEWVETTAKNLEEAREAALDQLGVGADEAEFDVLEEPKPGLFGRTRGQARLRARVKPTAARPKQERRRKSKSDKPKSDKPKSDKPKSDKSKSDKSRGAKSRSDNKSDDSGTGSPESALDAGGDEANGSDSSSTESGGEQAPRQRSSRGRGGDRAKRGNGSNNNNQEKQMSNDDRPESTVTPQEVGDAAVSFMNDLVTAFGATGEAELTIDGTELDVQVRGDDLGLMVGPGGRTLNAIQDLVRVAAQRRLGDHDTRLRIDVAGYRERRTVALGKFAADVAAQVRDSGTARSLEPMTSADRKVIHDALNDEDGVASSSSGEDPYRRVIVEPA